MTRAPVWDLLPDDLRALGYRRDAGHLFGRFQRVATWDDQGPALSREARALADASLDLALPRIVDEVPSQDGSTRLVFALADGAKIEAVHMPRAVRRPRVTVCLSSQVGCAMGCTFCATARMGLVRNLAAHEIVGQLLALLHRYGPLSAQQLSIVFMGMGEPLHNVEARDARARRAVRSGRPRRRAESRDGVDRGTRRGARAARALALPPRARGERERCDRRGAPAAHAHRQEVAAERAPRGARALAAAPAPEDHARVRAPRRRERRRRERRASRGLDRRSSSHR